MSYRAGLTVAVMVKNDAERLRRGLESARGVADELVVLDTGSEDDTVATALACGARVEEIEWPGRFDVGVNRLLDMVETEWTLRLDSDEWLREEDFPLLRAAMADAEAFCYFLVGHDLLPEGKTQEQLRRRMWRTDPRMRVRGALHENFVPETLLEVAAGREEKVCLAKVMHDGYLGGAASKEKRRRNIEMLRIAVKEDPDSVYHRIALAEEMHAVGDPMARYAIDELVDEALDSDEDDPRWGVMAIVPFRYALDGLTDGNLRSKRVDRMLRFLLTRFDAVPLALWTVANVEVRRKNLGEAYRVLRHLERIAEEGSYSAILPVDQAHLTTALWATLAPLARAVGDEETAARNYARLRA
jgi:glycosyltransferase involved in cell wall biosynthesis